MIRAFPILSICLLPNLVQAESILPPSGQVITFHEVIWEQEGDKNTYRFRYIAPKIARGEGAVSFDQAEADLLYLCDTSALPALIKQGRKADIIVISLSALPMEFGKTAPDVVQFFDVYRPDGEACVWQGF